MVDLPGVRHVPNICICESPKLCELFVIIKNIQVEMLQLDSGT